jgi:hypothetical protein
MLAILLFHLPEANSFCYLVEINGENGLYILHVINAKYRFHNNFLIPTAVIYLRTCCFCCEEKQMRMCSSKGLLEWSGIMIQGHSFDIVHCVYLRLGLYLQHCLCLQKCSTVRRMVGFFYCVFLSRSQRQNRL